MLFVLGVTGHVPPPFFFERAVLGADTPIPSHLTGRFTHTFSLSLGHEGGTPAHLLFHPAWGSPTRARALVLTFRIFEHALFGVSRQDFALASTFETALSTDLFPAADGAHWSGPPSCQSLGNVAPVGCCGQLAGRPVLFA